MESDKSDTSENSESSDNVIGQPVVEDEPSSKMVFVGAGFIIAAYAIQFLKGLLGVVVGIIAIPILWIVTDTPFMFLSSNFKSMLSALVACMISIPIALIVGSIASVPFYIAEWVNNKRDHFVKENPYESQRMNESITSSSGMLIIATMFIGAIPLFILTTGFRYEAFEIVTIISSISWIVVYGSLLYRFRHLGGWAFEQVRHTAMTYIVATPLSLLVISFGYYPLFYIYMKMEFWAKNDMSPLFGSKWAAVYSSDALIPIVWDLPIAGIMEGLLWSIGIALVVTRLLAALFRKDRLTFVLMLLGISAPFIIPVLLDRSGNMIAAIESVLKHVPIPVIAVLVAVLIDTAVGFLKNKLKYSVICSDCGQSLSRTMNYCPICGNAIKDTLPKIG